MPERSRLSARRKGLLVVLDGLGDRPHPALGGATPLETARTPFLDHLTTNGLCGLTDPLDSGVPVDTPTGTGVLFGVSDEQVRALARGPVEAAGVGLKLSTGDVAVRCNFATVERRPDGGFVVLDRRAGRIREGTEALAEALTDVALGEGVTATLKAASQHRAVVRLSGPELSAEVTHTDPASSIYPAPVLVCEPRPGHGAAAARTAHAVNALLDAAFDHLDDHPVNRRRRENGLLPANGLITRGAGVPIPLRSSLDGLGLSGAVVAGERTIIGLARLLGFHVETRPSFTAMPDTDLEGKVATALGLLETHDVVFLHVKAPDICAHDQDPELKRDVLEHIDGALAAIPLHDLVVGVCGDHCTDSNRGEHCGDPVPAVLHASGLARDDTSTFDEASCEAGALGRLAASRFLSVFLEALNTPAS